MRSCPTNGPVSRSPATGRATGGRVDHPYHRTPVDVDLALRQWADYVAAFEANGWRTGEVAPADDCPDAPFVEDTMVVSGNLAVIARPGAQARLGETPGAAAAARDLGMQLASVTAPGTLYGGDVLKLGRTWSVGTRGRTNEKGVKQLSAIAGAHGISVVNVPITGVLHLKSAITALPDGGLLANVPAIGRPDLLPPLTPSPDRRPWRMILLGRDRVLLSTSAPRTANLLADRGYTPVVVDISEFENARPASPA